MVVDIPRLDCETGKPPMESRQPPQRRAKSSFGECSGRSFLRVTGIEMCSGCARWGARQGDLRLIARMSSFALQHLGRAILDPVSGPGGPPLAAVRRFVWRVGCRCEGVGSLDARGVCFAVVCVHARLAGRRWRNDFLLHEPPKLGLGSHLAFSPTYAPGR